MTGFQLAMLSGALIGFGVVSFVAWLVPAPVNVKDAVGRLQPKLVTDPAMKEGKEDLELRVGRWAGRHLPSLLWGNPSDQDLALLGRSKASFYGAKIISAAVGLLVVPLLMIVLLVAGIEVPFGIPAVVSIVLAVMLWLLPNNELKDQAAKAREEFSYALGAFVEMVALERLVGSTVPQALAHAAKVGDSWPFERLAAVLRKTQYTGQSPWDALHAMGEELGLNDLIDLADIMRLGGADGTQVYESLRARGKAMRNATLNQQVARANTASERIAVPVGLLVVVLAATLVTPAFLAMF